MIIFTFKAVFCRFASSNARKKTLDRVCSCESWSVYPVRFWTHFEHCVCMRIVRGTGPETSLMNVHGVQTRSRHSSIGRSRRFCGKFGRIRFFTSPTLDLTWNDWPNAWFECKKWRVRWLVNDHHTRSPESGCCESDSLDYRINFLNEFLHFLYFEAKNGNLKWLDAFEIEKGKTTKKKNKERKWATSAGEKANLILHQFSGLLQSKLILILPKHANCIISISSASCLLAGNHI